jgi:sirohydrochlorin ferrochelatase
VSEAPDLVLIDHGSREAAANAVVEEVAAALRARLPGRRVEVAHLELCPPDLAAAVERCVAAGARRIVVVPFFLAPGRHSARDIPELAAAAADRHPSVSIRVAAPLGAHPGLVEAVLERVSEGGDPPRRG